MEFLLKNIDFKEGNRDIDGHDIDIDFEYSLSNQSLETIFSCKIGHKNTGWRCYVTLTYIITDKSFVDEDSVDMDKIIDFIKEKLCSLLIEIDSQVCGTSFIIEEKEDNLN